MDQAAPEEIAQAAQQHGCKSVAFTYNDPVIFAEYAMDTAAACHKRGIKTVAVTAGYMHDQARREFYAKMDAANVDLKAFTENFYFKITGSHLQPVLDTLIYLKRETQVWLEITTLLIPGKNDSDAEITTLSQWIMKELGPDVPLHFSAFHPIIKCWMCRPRQPQRLSARVTLRYAPVCIMCIPATCITLKATPPSAPRARRRLSCVTGMRFGIIT